MANKKMKHRNPRFSTRPTHTPTLDLDPRAHTRPTLSTHARNPHPCSRRPMHTPVLARVDPTFASAHVPSRIPADLHSRRPMCAPTHSSARISRPTCGGCAYSRVARLSNAPRRTPLPMLLPQVRPPRCMVELSMRTRIPLLPPPRAARPPPGATLAKPTRVLELTATPVEFTPSTSPPPLSHTPTLQLLPPPLTTSATHRTEACGRKAHTQPPSLRTRQPNQLPRVHPLAPAPKPVPPSTYYPSLSRTHSHSTPPTLTPTHGALATPNSPHARSLALTRARHAPPVSAHAHSPQTRPCPQPALGSCSPTRLPTCTPTFAVAVNPQTRAACTHALPSAHR
ncbi:hypothetical protein FIBSPDRAFT_1047976 [Athelia psychrophila]|uniref:Uncharacterized protein n=1 Tax=Athelia psychrophila TaxID=1759441 RepID=A0A166EBE9_9AGAM|nr:hypothetical protein FIBSPDRAFT_1047976 [Fibularhizoctonia sp. CBS 109695]